MIFGTRNNDRFQLKLEDCILSICKEFKYLGGIFFPKVAVTIKL